MCIHDNKTCKIYSNLNPTATQEQQESRLKKLTKIEAYLLDEIEVCERLAKKMKRFNTITSIADTVPQQLLLERFLLMRLQVVLVCLLVLH